MEPRDACLHDPVLLTLLIAGNLAISLAYIAIPISLIRVGLRLRKPPPFPVLWALSVAFIGVCGLTHAAAALVFFRPAWHLEAALCVATAIISVATACLLWLRVCPIVDAIRGYTALADEMKKASDARTG